MTRHFLALAFVALLAPPAHAGRRNVNPDVVEDALAFTLTDREKSVRLLEDALAHGEGFKRKEARLVMVHAGEQHRLLGDYEAARDWFQRVLAERGGGWEKEAARLGLALVDAADGVDARVLRVLVDVAERDALDTQNADRFLLLAVRALKRDDAAAVRDHSRRALDHGAEDPAVYERIRAHLQAMAEPSADEGEEATEEEDAAAMLAPISDLDKAEKALAAGDRELARELAQRVLSAGSAGAAELEPASDEDRLVAGYLLRRLDAADVRPGVIGVLLPLSGRYEAAGSQVRRALEFGWRAAGGEGELRFVDTGTTPETAVAALEELVLEQGAIAVLGPLLTEETEAVVTAAQALRVPLVGLSQALEPEPEQEWIFQAMVTPQDQVEALVDYVWAQGMDAFAIFAPDTNYGHTAAEAFEEAVAARGGEITVQTFYDEEATDLVPFAQELGRKDYETRGAEFRELKRIAEEQGGNPDRVVLPPTIDFDALFLPDSASRIPLAAASLAYEEFPLGEFQTSRDGETIPMLGLNGWNHPALVHQGGLYVHNAIFTDAFLPDGERGEAFARLWEEKTGRPPKPLEAVAVDAGRLVAAATRADPTTRAAFRQALLAVDVDGAVTGARAFEKRTRSAERDIRLLTITSQGEIVPLEPAAAPAEAAGVDPDGTDPL